MYKITCDYCFEDHFFEAESKAPQTCTNCNSSLKHLAVVDVDATEETGLSSIMETGGLIFTYQKTGETIEIPHSDIMVLGRQNTGKELLGKLPHISREHCKVEFLNGHYLLTDLNSLNGTFLGPTRRDCRKHMKQELKDNDVIYFGQEPFLLTIIATDAAVDSADASDMLLEEELLNLKFKCKACGKIHDMNLMICDNCGSYGQIEHFEK